MQELDDNQIRQVSGGLSPTRMPRPLLISPPVQVRPLPRPLPLPLPLPGPGPDGDGRDGFDPVPTAAD
jgi:hypothetical protein